MRRHSSQPSRITRVLTRGFWVICVTTAIVWVLSIRLRVGYEGSMADPGGQIMFGCANGRVAILWSQLRDRSVLSELSLRLPEPQRWSLGVNTYWQRARLWATKGEIAKIVRYSFGFDLPVFHGSTLGSIRCGCVLPLWIPSAATGVLASVLWWLGTRRLPSGYCRRCGYNLRGNVSDICPECGSEVDPPDPQGG